MPIENSVYGLTFADNTVNTNGQPEHASFEVSFTPMSLAGDNTALIALVGNLETAIAALSIGVITKKNIVFQRETLPDVPASSTLAQRENKYLCRYHNPSTGKKFRASIPCADLTKLVSGSEFVVTASGPGAALKTAWAAVVVDPDDGSTLTVLDSIQFVGRNS
jgi:hypothetical protein